MVGKRPFGSLDVNVSVLGFGGASVSGEGGGYGFGHISEEAALVLLRDSFERGINLFDTAPVYGFGLSEKRIGKALAPYRDRIVICSKGGVTWDLNKRIGIDTNPRVIQKMLEQSLKDLKTDCLDIYMIHWPDKHTDIRRPMEYLSRAKEEKKILAIGLCNSSVDEIAKAMEVDRIDAVQSELNLFNPSAHALLANTIREHNMGFMSWGTLDKGILTGRVTPDRVFDEVDARSWAPWWKNDDRNHKYRAMRKIEGLLKESGHSGLELALGYVLHFEEVSSALCGIRTPEQLESAITALNNLPPLDILEEARSIAEEELRSRDDTPPG